MKQGPREAALVVYLRCSRCVGFVVRLFSPVQYAVVRRDRKPLGIVLDAEIHERQARNRTGSNVDGVRARRA